MSRRNKIFQIFMITAMLLLSVQGCQRNTSGAEEMSPGLEGPADQGETEGQEDTDQGETENQEDSDQREAENQEDSDQREAEGQGDLPDMKETAGQASMADPDKAQLSSVRDEVLEVGIVVDCSNPYAVVVFEQFCQEAKACDTPVVVELHDSDSSYDKALQQLEWLAERGIDLLLVDVGTIEEQEKLGQEIRSMGYPTLYFGLRPEKLEEELKSSYMGLGGEEQEELEQALEREQFEESGFRQRAQEDGRKLWERVWEIL